MFNFDGRAKSRRPISLGNKYTESSQDILQKAAQERALRELQRRKSSSATKIASVYRQYKLRSKLTDFFTAEFDTQIEQSSLNIERLVRMNIFFDLGVERMARLCKVLEADDWNQLHDQTLVMFIHKLWNLYSENMEKLTSIEFILKLFLAANPHKLFSRFSSFYPCLRKCILTDLLSAEKYSTLVDLMFSPFTTLNVRDSLISEYLVQFYVQILTIPLLLNRIKVGAVPKLASKIPYEAIILKINSSLVDNLSIVTEMNVQEDGFEYQGAVSLLANVVALGNYRLPKLPNTFILAFSNTINNLLQFCPLFTFSMGGGQESDAGFEDEDDDVYNETVMFDPKLRPWLQMLYSPTIMSCIVRLLPEHIESASKTILLVYNHFPDSQSSILNTLLYGNNGESVRGVYRALTKTELFAYAQNPLSMTSDLFERFEHEWFLLILLAEALVRLLYTCGNEEFHSQQENLFGLQSIIEFTQCIRNIAFQMFLSGDKYPIICKNRNLNFVTVRATLTKLLNQVHLRDSYRQFCPDGYWEVNWHRFNLQLILRDYLRSEKSTPDLEIIENIPFVIGFDERVLLFHQFSRVSDDTSDIFDIFQGRSARETVRIRRDHVFEDGFDQLYPMGKRLKKRIYVTFVSEHGYEEAGVDGGGLFKDLLTELFKKAFDVNTGLFVETHEHLLYPNPSEYALSDENLQLFKFLGMIVGKALLEGVLLESSFAGFFLAKWLGRPSYLEELPSLDPELYKNLTFLKNYNAEDLSLNFTTVNSEFGQNKVVELVPGGKDIQVTNENKIEYIYAVAYYKLNTQIRIQSLWFLKGLYEIVDLTLIKMFSQRELHLIVSGADSHIDIDDLRENTEYSGPYDDKHPVIEMFWLILRRWNEEKKKKFLKFVTSCSRPPLLGFKQLEPRFGIRHPGSDVSRLPSASTCFNLLKLPPYSDVETMESKLNLAINSAQGFELS